MLSVKSNTSDMGSYMRLVDICLIGNPIKNFKMINFSGVYDLIKVLKTKQYILSGNKLRALIEILKNPFDIFKFKFLNW